MMVTPFFTARSISRLICADSFALEEKISTMARQCSMESTMAEPYSVPGTTSRGAIQQRMPEDSSTAHAASAAGLSLLE